MSRRYRCCRCSPVYQTGVFVVTEAIVLLRLEEDTAACRRRDKLVETADAVNRA